MVTKTKSDPINWNAIFMAMLTGATTLGGIWLNRELKEATVDRVRMEGVLTTQTKNIDTVKKNTDGAITAALLVAAQATKRTADVSKDPKDVEIAKVAQEAYETQKLLQEEIKTESPPP